jgi:hypothetical protein
MESRWFVWRKVFLMLRKFTICLVMLSLLALSAPTLAEPQQQARLDLWSFLERLIPDIGWPQKTGSSIDPNGGDQGPGIDPNGLAYPPPTDTGSGMDPSGLEGGPGIDPNGQDTGSGMDPNGGG